MKNGQHDDPERGETEILFETKPVAQDGKFCIFKLPNFSQFLRIVQSREFQSKEFVYRGQRDMDAPLASSLARRLEGLEAAERQTYRKEHFDNFIRYSRGRIAASFQNPLGVPVAIADAVRKTDKESHVTNPAIWALGQHYGLGTPLLDWTRKPLIALYFAFERSLPPRGWRSYRVVFALNAVAAPTFDVSKIRQKEEQVFRYEADELCDPRLIAQHGLFTYSTTETPIERWAMRQTERGDAVLLKFLIPEVDRRTCLEYLDKTAGINNHSLFPDLTGSASYCAQLLEDRRHQKHRYPAGQSSNAQAADKHRKAVGEYLEDLKRAAKTEQAAGGRVKKPSMEVILNNTPVQFNDLEAGDGASGGFSFVGQHPNGHRYFIKIPDISRPETVDGQLDYVEKESHVLRVIEGLDGVPTEVSAGYLKIDKSRFTAPVLISRFINGDRLDQLMCESDLQGKIHQEWLVHLGLRLSEILESVHNKRVVHSFMSPRYVIFEGWTCGRGELPDPASARLVGFGYADFWREGGPLRQTPKMDKKYSPPELRENRYDLGGSSFHSDIYSLGALLFICGSKSESVPEGDNETILEGTEWREGVQLLFLKAIIAKCINTQPASRYQAMERLRDDLVVALQLLPTGADSDGRQLQLRHLEGVTKPIPSKSTRREEGLDAVVEDLRRDFSASVGKAPFEVFGHREKLLQFMCTLFARLPARSEYRTATHARYWTGRNLGVYGRFFALNSDLTRGNRVQVYRLFLTADDPLEMTQEEQIVLHKHAEITSGATTLTTRVCKVPEADTLQFESQNELVAVISCQNKHVGLSFISRGEVVRSYDRTRIRGEVVKICVIPLGEDQARREIGKFDDMWRKATDIADFLRLEELQEASLAKILGLDGVSATESEDPRH